MPGYKVEVAVVNPTGQFGNGQHATMRLTAPDGTTTVIAFYPRTQAGELTPLSYAAGAAVMAVATAAVAGLGGLAAGTFGATVFGVAAAYAMTPFYPDITTIADGAVLTLVNTTDVLVSVNNKDMNLWKRYTEVANIVNELGQYDQASQQACLAALNQEFSIDSTEISEDQYNRILEFTRIAQLAADDHAFPYHAWEDSGVNCAGFIRRALAYSGVDYKMAFNPEETWFANYKNENWKPKALIGLFSGENRYDDTVSKSNWRDNVLVSSYPAGSLDGGTGDDALIGNASVDVLAGGAGNDWLYGGDGNDTLDGGEDADRLFGGKGDDKYVADNTNDRVVEVEGEGVDTIVAKVDFTLSANIENGIQDEAAENGKLTGNGLDNILQGNSHDNHLIGAAGDDKLYGGSGEDVLEGGDDKDTLVGGLDHDVLIGGADDDTYLITDADDIVEETNGGVDTALLSSGGALPSFTLPDNVENATLLTGSSYSEIVGNELDNVLIGNDGGNVLRGGGGADVLQGGHGNDIYVLDSLDTTLIEADGDGVDTVQLAGSGLAGATYSLDQYFENGLILESAGGAALCGNAESNVLTGNTAANSLYGGGGSDTIHGGGGDDTVVGGPLADFLYGDLGNDSLVGGGGDDVIDGGAGNDILSSTSGAAILRGGDGTDSLTTGGSGAYLYGDAGNDSLLDQGSHNVLAGGIGNDTLLMQGSDVTADGGAGGDTLRNQGQHTLMRGGAGTDLIFDETGGATYVWSKGDGTDIVQQSQGSTTFRFDDDKGSYGLTATRSGSSLIVRASDGGSVSFSGWFTGRNRSTIQAPDGTVWTPAQIDAQFSDGVYDISYSTGVYRIEDAMPMLLNYVPSLDNVQLSGSLRNQHYGSVDTLSLALQNQYGDPLVDQYGQKYRHVLSQINDYKYTDWFYVSPTIFGLEVSETNGTYAGYAFADAAGMLAWDYWTDSHGQGYIALTNAASSVRVGYEWLVPPTEESPEWRLGEQYSSSPGPSVSSHREVEMLAPPVNSFLMYSAGTTTATSISSEASTAVSDSQDSLVSSDDMANATDPFLAAEANAPSDSVAAFEQWWQQPPGGSSWLGDVGAWLEQFDAQAEASQPPTSGNHVDAVAQMWLSGSEASVQAASWMRMADHFALESALRGTREDMTVPVPSQIDAGHRVFVQPLDTSGFGMPQDPTRANASPFVPAMQKDFLLVA